MTFVWATLPFSLLLRLGKLASKNYILALPTYGCTAVLEGKNLQAS
jgi:hypothetical protein